MGDNLISEADSRKKANLVAVLYELGKYVRNRRDYCIFVWLFGIQPSNSNGMIARSRNRWLSATVLSCGLLNAAVAVSAAQYEADGEIEQTLFTREGGVQGMTRSKFTVYVKDCSWLIQTTDYDKDGTALRVRETGCTNGAEIYEVAGPYNKESWKKGVAHWNEGLIVSNTIPVGQMDDYFVCHLWLMFASGCYFQNLTTNWLTPIYGLGDPARETKWDLVGGPVALPMNVTYFERPGVPDGTYTALGLTNVGTVQMPLGFVFEQRINSGFAPSPIASGDSGPTYRIRKIAISSVTAVRPVCSRSDLSPTAAGKTIVIDERLPQSASSPGVASYFGSSTFSVDG